MRILTKKELTKFINMDFNKLLLKTTKVPKEIKDTELEHTFILLKNTYIEFNGKVEFLSNHLGLK